MPLQWRNQFWQSVGTTRMMRCYDWSLVSSWILVSRQPHMVTHSPSIAFRHLLPNCARIGYATEGALHTPSIAFRHLPPRNESETSAWSLARSMPSVHASNTEKGRPASAAGNALLASVCSSAVHRHEVVWWLGWDFFFFWGGGGCSDACV